MTKAVKLVNALAMLAALHVLGTRLHAQASLGHAEDASTPPKGVLRLRPIISWTRYDSRFWVSGVEPLGGRFTSDSLSWTDYPPLGFSQQSIAALAQTPGYRLSLGRSRLQATARDDIMPFAFDFGVTRRIAVSVVVPVVRRRIASVFQLDSTGSNVGPNLNRTSTAATQQNALVQTEFTNAAALLQSALTSCQASPSGPGCAAILADAPALLTDSQLFADVVESLYGSAASSGQPFVPRASSAEQAAIAARIATYNTRYRALLGTDVIQAVPFGAPGPAGTAEFQSAVINDFLGDSLNSQERVGIGDVEVGVKVRLIDRAATERRSYGLQLALAGGARLPTGSTKRRSSVVDLSLGDGEVVFNGSAVLDAAAGRFGLTTAATASFTPAGADAPVFDLFGPERPSTDWLEVLVRPRWHLSQALALHGAYSQRIDNGGSHHLAGGGVSFMPLPTAPGRSPPMEVRFTHLEAIRGDAGRPKFFREQLEVRLYLRIFR
jgi:hypothetical protein